MDRSLYEDLNGFAAHHAAVARVVEFLALDGIYVLFALLVLTAVAPPRWSGGRGRPAFVAAGLSTALALLVAKVVSDLVARPRPFVADPGSSHVLVNSATDYTFPSDHATAAFAIAVALTTRLPRLGYPALALAGAIAVSRVAAGVHYPADVLAGAAIGTACALILYLPGLRMRIDMLARTGGGLVDRFLATARNRVRRIDSG